MERRLLRRTLYRITDPRRTGRGVFLLLRDGVGALGARELGRSVVEGEAVGGLSV